MVVLLVKAHPDMENVEAFEIPDDHEWNLDIFIPSTGELRENVKLTRTEEIEIPNSRGTCNLLLKVDKNVYATLLIENIPKVTRSVIGSEEGETGKAVPVLAVDCRGCEIKSWKPTGYYKVTTPTGTVFDEVDLQSGEWYDVDPESNILVSIMSMKSTIEVYRK